VPPGQCVDVVRRGEEEVCAEAVVGVDSGEVRLVFGVLVLDVWETDFGLGRGGRDSLSFGGVGVVPWWVRIESSLSWGVWAGGLFSMIVIMGIGGVIEKRGSFALSGEIVGPRSQAVGHRAGRRMTSTATSNSNSTRKKGYIRLLDPGT
jgi:hypothetical protein